MIIRRVWGVLPAYITYTDDLPPTVGGRTDGNRIRLRHKYEGADEGIHQHELLHVKQWYATLGTLRAWLQWFPRFRLWCEVEAYRKQLTYYADDRAALFATFLAGPDYGFHITEAEALALLRDHGHT